jgi:rhamnosyltransferase
MISPVKENIAAIIVAHNPGGNFLNNLKTLADQVGKIIIINSGPNKVNRDIVLEFGGKAELISNKEDFGQGRDLNEGVSFAISNGFDWFLLMDQDSFCHKDLAQELIRAYNLCPFKEKIGAIGSNCVYKRLGEVKYPNKNAEKVFFERDIVMTTGTLLSRDAFEKSGVFREEFFIDSIDTDYSLKIRKAGFKIIISYNAKLDHTVGNSNRAVNFFGKKILVTNHSARRCYYMIRNGLILVKEYCLKEPYWALRRVGWCFLIKPWLIVLYEDNKAEKLKEMIRGFWHAIKNKTGKYEK